MALKVDVVTLRDAVLDTETFLGALGETIEAKGSCYFENGKPLKTHDWLPA